MAQFNSNFMQTPMFVFIGIPKTDSDADLLLLFERLNEKYQNNTIAIQFSYKEETKLLSANLDNVQYYISLLENIDELPDWLNMATDFELMVDITPVNKDYLLQRYAKMKNLGNYPYNKINYATAIVLFDEINNFKNLTIISFQ